MNRLYLCFEYVLSNRVYLPRRITIQNRSRATSPVWMTNSSHKCGSNPIENYWFQTCWSQSIVNVIIRRFVVDISVNYCHFTSVVTLPMHQRICSRIIEWCRHVRPYRIPKFCCQLWGGLRWQIWQLSLEIKRNYSAKQRMHLEHSTSIQLSSLMNVSVKKSIHMTTWKQINEVLNPTQNVNLKTILYKTGMWNSWKENELW